jgi:hypothetical protein
MSTPKNNIIRSIAPKSLFESAFPVLSTSVTYNQGDLLAFDTSSKILKPISATGDAANCLGVARQTVVSGVVKSPYQGTPVDASQAIEDVAGPVYGVVASLTLKTGDAFNPGDKVYLVTTDAQTVTSTTNSGGANVGIFQGPAVASAAAGQTGAVLIGARYGTTDIKF